MEYAKLTAVTIHSAYNRVVVGRDCVRCSEEVMSIYLKLYDNIRHYMIKYLMSGRDNKCPEFQEETC